MASYYATMYFRSNTPYTKRVEGVETEAEVIAAIRRKYPDVVRIENVHPVELHESKKVNTEIKVEIKPEYKDDPSFGAW